MESIGSEIHVSFCQDVYPCIVEIGGIYGNVLVASLHSPSACTISDKTQPCVPLDLHNARATILKPFI